MAVAPRLGRRLGPSRRSDMLDHAGHASLRRCSATPQYGRRDVARPHGIRCAPRGPRGPVERSRWLSAIHVATSLRVPPRAHAVRRCSCRYRSSFRPPRSSHLASSPWHIEASSLRLAVRPASWHLLLHSPTTPPSSATLTRYRSPTVVAKRQPQPLDVRGQLHRGPDALTDRAVGPDARVVVAHAQLAAAPGDDEGVRGHRISRMAIGTPHCHRLGSAALSATRSSTSLARRAAAPRSSQIHGSTSKSAMRSSDRSRANRVAGRRERVAGMLAAGGARRASGTAAVSALPILRRSRECDAHPRSPIACSGTRVASASGTSPAWPFGRC